MAAREPVVPAPATEDVAPPPEAIVEDPMALLAAAERSAPLASSRSLGVIKWFDATKGWGFVTGSDGADAFVHRSQMAETMPWPPPEGCPVSFEPKVSARGLQALDVRPAPGREGTAFG